MLVRLSVLCVFLITGSLSWAEQVQLTADERKMKQAMENNASTAIEEIQKGLRESKIRYKAGRQSKQSFQGTNKGLNRQLGSFKKTPYQVPGLKTWMLKPGAIGFLRCGISSTEDNTDDRFKVFQIIDDENMLVETYRGHSSNFRGSSVFRKELTLWVSGVSTSGMTDGTYVQLPQIFEVTGTKGYSTAIGGKRTVIQIAPFSIQAPSQIKDKLQQIKKQKQLLRSIVKLKTECRVWTDVTGKYKITAKLLSRRAKEVVLEKEDGKEITMPISKLSKRDRKKIRDVPMETQKQELSK